MTWISRAAPSAAEPRGGSCPSKGGGGAGRTTRAQEGEQTGERERKNATGLRSRAALAMWAVPRGRRAKGEGEGGART